MRSEIVFAQRRGGRGGVSSVAALDPDHLKWPPPLQGRGRGWGASASAAFVERPHPNPSPEGEGLILAQRNVILFYAALHHVLMEPCRGQSDTLSASSAPPREQNFLTPLPATE